MVKVYTAQFRYWGIDRLDISARQKTPFSPTWRMVTAYKKGTISERQYEKMYLTLMKESFQSNHQVWEELLNRKRVTLVCYCPSGAFCHRVLLARYLEGLGAQYGGEIGQKSIKT